MELIDVRIVSSDSARTLQIERGANLRRSLLEAGVSPYAQLTRQLNCGGRGLCATCGVWIREGAPEATHWHDRAAARWGYPRLSCQVQVEAPMTIALVDKLIWGPREPTSGQ